MSKIKIVDARMGRGKTSAAVEYMNSHPDKRFVYVTPYLAEVDRICKSCDFEQPKSNKDAKLIDFYNLVDAGKNISTTHSLLSFVDDWVLDLIRRKHYTIIIDEAINVVEKLTVSDADYALLSSYISVDDSGRIYWLDDSYDGTFNKYKNLATAGAMYKYQGEFIAIAKPELFEAFDEVIMMTYLFDGQLQKAFLDFFGFEYMRCGVDTSNGFKLTDNPDNPPPIDYHDLIHIIEDDDLNDVGKSPRNLCKSWFNRRGRYHPDICRLRGHMQKITRRMFGNVSSNRILWTTFKSAKKKLLGDNGRYGSSFLQINARATNEYRDKDVVMYLANRYVDPALKSMFEQRGVTIDDDQFALSEMLQFIWRSAIRDGKPITLYIPSKRMRTLLTNWIDEVSMNKMIKIDKDNKEAITEGDVENA